MEPNKFTPESPAILEKELSEYLLDKAPFHLPENVREIIVKIAPWLVVILMVIAIPAILAVFAAGALVSFWAASVGVSLGTAYYISIVFLIITVVLELIALPGLFARKRSGWVFVYYANLVSFVGNVINFSVGGLISAVIGLVIGLYILFQIRSYYK